jgi:very-short-patch-repair endonuclease
MTVVDVITRMGGVADAKTLVRFTSRKKVRTALAHGDIVRDRHGRFALPTADEARRAANELSAVTSHESAAAWLGWELKQQPAVPCLTVPRNRKIIAADRGRYMIRWSDLRPDEIDRDRVTTPGRTVIDCAKTLPFDEALTIADSALRHGRLSSPRLEALAQAVPTSGRSACLRVAREADSRAANPFESVLRAIALDVPRLKVVPQLVITEGRLALRPDLVDPDLRLVLEADSFEFHGSRKAMKRDCERYNWLVRHGWTVLRFTWEHVMYEQEYVAETLAVVAQGPRRRATPPIPGAVQADQG